MLGIQPSGFSSEFEYIAENHVESYLEILADRIATTIETGRRLRFAEGAQQEVISIQGRERLIARERSTGRFTRLYE